MSNDSWESKIALVLLAVFVLIAIVVLAKDRIELAHAMHGLLTA